MHSRIATAVIMVSLAPAAWAGRVLAPGNPPLTEEVATAYSQFSCFMLSEALGQRGGPNAGCTALVSAALVRGYAAVPAEQRQMLAQVPAAWTEFQKVWPLIQEEQKNQLRAQWAQALGLAQPEGPPPAATASTPPDTSVGTGMSHEELRAKIAADHQSYMDMSQLGMSTHETIMSIINNIAD